MQQRTAERVARNNSTFRDANEHISAKAIEYRMAGDVPFICECAEESCTEILRLSLDAYGKVRSESTTFVYAPGHQSASGAHVRVVEERDGYVVVVKVGEAADLARELDPRRD